MRKKRPIDALFPKIRQGLLAATFGEPERWWYLSELAAQLETKPSSLQRELQSLVESGILRERREGKRLYFQAENDSPVFNPLRELVTQTLGVKTALQDALLEFQDKIYCAFIYGSVANANEHALSDVDVMIIGSLGLSDIAPTMRKLENKYNREFNANCYTESEFIKKLQDENHFLTGVLRKEKIFLLGDESDLDGLNKKPDGADAQHKR